MAGPKSQIRPCLKRFICDFGPANERGGRGSRSPAAASVDVPLCVVCRYGIVTV